MAQAETGIQCELAGRVQMTCWIQLVQKVGLDFAGVAVACLRTQAHLAHIQDEWPSMLVWGSSAFRDGRSGWQRQETGGGRQEVEARGGPHVVNMRLDSTSEKIGLTAPSMKP